MQSTGYKVRLALVLFSKISLRIVDLQFISDQNDCVLDILEPTTIFNYS
jgi:hypothetical protein